jgi:hypothetical protein
LKAAEPAAGGRQGTPADGDARAGSCARVCKCVCARVCVSVLAQLMPSWNP